MYGLAKGLTALAVLTFVLAVVGNFTGGLLHTSPEGFSRAANNLALLAIALVVVFEDGGLRSRPGTLP
jgi:hypothetical protein